MKNFNYGLDSIYRECTELIRLGKRTGDMKLKNLARKALFGLLADDGTYGLGDYLWKTEVLPNLKAARNRAAYIQQTISAVNSARILGLRHQRVNLEEL